MTRVVVKDAIMNDVDSQALLNLLEVDGEELLTAMGEEAEFLSLEVCLDSGAGDHVLANLDVPG